MIDQMRVWMMVICCFSFGQAQDKYANLKDTFILAGQHYNVVFSFDDELISQFEPPNISFTKNIEEFIGFLTTHYNLTFDRKGNNIVVVPRAETKENKICGYIKNTLTKKGISDLRVKIGKHQTFTDANGYFSLTHLPTAQGKLIIIDSDAVEQMEDYQVKKSCQEYFVTQETIELHEVAVEYIVPPVLKKTSGAVTVDLGKMKTTPGVVTPDILDLIQLFPGVSSPNGNNSIYVRGGTPDQNNIQWNSIRLYQMHHANGGLSAINPYSVDKFHFFNKGVSSHYGEHISSLVLMEKSPMNNTSRSNATVGLNVLDGDLATNINWNHRFYLSLTARQSHNNHLSQSFTSNSFNQFREKTVNQTTFSEQLLFYNDWKAVAEIPFNPSSYLQLSAFRFSDRIDYELYDDAVEFRDHLDSSSLGLGVHYSHKNDHRSHDFHLTLTTYEMDYSRYLEQYSDEDEDGAEEYLKRSMRSNTVKAATFRYGNEIMFPYGALDWGMEATMRRVEFFYLPNITSSNTNENVKTAPDVGSLYMNWEMPISDQTQLAAGVRYNYFVPLKKSSWEPRLSLTQSILTKWSLVVSYEHKSQSVFQSNEAINNSIDRINNIWVGIEQDLHPLLTSRLGSVGLIHKTKNALFEIDLYQKRIDGLTTYSYGYLDPNDQDYHTGKSNGFGLEMFYQKKWKSGIFWMAYTYQENKNTFDDLLEGVPYNSNFLIKNQWNTGYNFSLRNWHMNISYKIRSGASYSKPATVVENENDYTLKYEQLNTHFLPIYQRLDISLSKQIPLFKKTRLDATLAMKNVTNKKNVLERIFYYNKKDNIIDSRDRYAMIPFVNFGVRLFWE